MTATPPCNHRGCATREARGLSVRCVYAKRVPIDLAAIRAQAAAETRGSKPTTLRVVRVLMPDGHWYVNGVKQ